jgi:hypothetical protein
VFESFLVSDSQLVPTILSLNDCTAAGMPLYFTHHPLSEIRTSEKWSEGG